MCNVVFGIAQGTSDSSHQVANVYRWFSETEKGLEYQCEDLLMNSACWNISQNTESPTRLWAEKN